MADRVEPAPSRGPAAPVPPAAPAKPALAWVAALPWLLFIATLAALAWLVFKPAKLGDPLATSLVAFERQNRLTVFSAQLAPVVTASDSRLFGLVNSKQVALIPARVDYTIDLSRVGRDRIAWNEGRRMLTVRLPPIAVGRPNLDEARAQYLREGVWITSQAQESLTRNNTRLAEQQAGKQAANPALLALARDAGRQAVAQNLAIPMRVAGYGNVRVTVIYDGEAAPN